MRSMEKFGKIPGKSPLEEFNSFGGYLEDGYEAVLNDLYFKIKNSPEEVTTELAQKFVQHALARLLEKVAKEGKNKKKEVDDVIMHVNKMNAANKIPSIEYLQLLMAKFDTVFPKEKKKDIEDKDNED